MDATRIYGESLDIDEHLVRDFFDARGVKYNVEHPYVSILYQDDNPDLAEKRDAFEKKKVLPLLQIDKNSKVLDVGCGIGRWADAIIDTVDYYHGIDISHALIEQAKSRLGEKANFSVLSASAMSLEALSTEPGNNSPHSKRFNRIIISGVFLYMNDSNVIKTLDGLSKMCDKSSLVYIREPIALKDRLTLNQHWSTELDTTYSAIYRSEAELHNLIERGLKGQFSVPNFTVLYDTPELNNRNETNQFFTILRAE
ncbi:MAG: class I SAM-dependent methyltransferase [Legionella sp.]|nr:class I SAM-dependent methyltransferase [Legionella sp.]